jgi:hypothetical protein
MTELSNETRIWVFGYAARIDPGIRSLALSCLGDLSTESGRSQGESEAFHPRGGKAIPQTTFWSKKSRFLTPDHSAPTMPCRRVKLFLPRLQEMVAGIAAAEDFVRNIFHSLI